MKNIIGCQINIPPRIFRCVQPRRKVLSCKRQMDERPMTIGTVDGESATWMTHPGAIYLHEAQSYFVEELNLEEHIARLHPIESDYYTESLRSTEIDSSIQPSCSSRRPRRREKMGRITGDHTSDRLSQTSLVHT